MKKNDLLSYNFDVIFQARKAAKAEKEKSVVKTVAVAQEQERSVYQTALDFLTRTKDLFDSIDSRSKDLQLLIGDSLNVKTPDNERRPINRKFQSVRKYLDQLAREGLVEGEPVFSGKYAQKAKVIPTGENSDDFLIIRLNSLLSSTLGLDHIAIDNLPAAKRAESQMEKVKAQLAETKDYLDYNLKNLNAQKDKLEKSKKPVEEDASDRSSTPQLSLLKDEQEKASVAKGRTYALLLNIKG